MATFVPIIHPWNQEIWQNLTLEPERSNHALLFAGNHGLGKLELAMGLAHFVLTDTHSQSENLFNAASHPDFHVLMPEIEVVKLEEYQNIMASFARRYLEHHKGKPKRMISIEQVRTLNQALTTHPHISKHRVVLIPFAETMNRNASNALLKSLEEPPANTLFIIVSDEVSKLAKTIRSRCSLINFRAPDQASARAWLELQSDIPQQEIDNHLAMANNHPLAALSLYQQQYIESLKSVFKDVNGLWNQRREVVQVAKNWQSIGGLLSIDILQKLTTDILRCSLSDSPAEVFFPVQQSWVQSVSSKFNRAKLLKLIDSLNYAKTMLGTTVDELLVLETVSNQFRLLPVQCNSG
jgi:DNA polymerase-3 subunit delta'